MSQHLSENGSARERHDLPIGENVQTDRINCSITNLTSRSNLGVNAKLLDLLENEVVFQVPAKTAAVGHRLNVHFDFAVKFVATAVVQESKALGFGQMLRVKLVQYESSDLIDLQDIIEKNQNQINRAIEILNGSEDSKSKTHSHVTVNISDFLRTEQILLVDPELSSRSVLQHTLMNFGVNRDQIFSSADFDTSMQMMSKNSVSVIFSELKLADRSALDLCRVIRKMNFPKMIFCLVSNATSRGVIAQAAQEEVDCWIARPYTPATFEVNLSRAINNRIYPEPYQLALKDGENCLLKNEIETAQLHFKKASDFYPLRALPYAQMAECYFRSGDFKQAASLLRTALRHNPGHYLSMVKLSNILLKNNELEECFSTLQRMARYCTLDPLQLTTSLRLAIALGKYDEIETFYGKHLQLQETTEDLIRHLCASLMVCGRYYLRRNHIERAVSLFVKAIAVGKGRKGILKEILFIATEENRSSVVLNLYAQYGNNISDTDEMQLCKFIMESNRQSSAWIQKHGMALISNGLKDPSVYQILLKVAEREKQDDEVQRLREAFHLEFKIKK